ncbi:MAG: response regulator [Halocynthiibacter sp.]
MSGPISPDKSTLSADRAEDLTRLNLLTHDIRSAVFDVIGGLRQVDHSKIDAETQLQLERIRTSGEILARLVEDAMNIIVDGNQVTDSIFANLHLHRLLKDVELRWAGRAHEKGVSFELEIAKDIPTVISTDRLGLERVLSNMLSNALKYSAGGTVRMSATLQDGCTLRFAVSDSGPGFSPEALAQLYSLDGRPKNTAKPGSGLGLHIAKNIADRIGGTIDIANTDSGATVTLSLPQRSWNDESNRGTDGSLPDLSDIRVLVAEDSESIRLVLTQMLQTMGAEFEVAKDGVEALNWLERERFDIALVDIDMPRLSGIEVMRYIRAQNSDLCNLPVMAVTAFVLRANRDAIFDAGADRILAKPIFGIEALGDSIDALLRVAGKPALRTSPAPGLEDLDETRFLRLLEIAGPEGAKELLLRLHSDLSDVHTKLLKSISQLDHTELRAQSHVLISLAGAVGADRLQRQAEALNSAAHLHEDLAIGRLGRAADRQLRSLIDRIDAEITARKGK